MPKFKLSPQLQLVEEGARGREASEAANPADGTTALRHYGTEARGEGKGSKGRRLEILPFFLQLGVGCRTGQGLLCCCDGGSSVLPHHCCQDRSLHETQRASPGLRPSQDKQIVIWC
jgi:hypothetical protein